MNAKDVSEALGQIDEQFVTEALTYTPRKTSLWRPIAAVAACLCLLVGLLVPAMGPMGASPIVGWHGGEAEVYHGDGVSVEGLVITGDTESVDVQDLRITLDVTHSPLDWVLPHQNTVSMEYTFHNPTDEPITLTLTLPCGQDPHYASSIEHETGTTLFDANRHLYTVSADNTPIDCRLRVTGSSLPPKEDGAWENGIFADDTPITRLTYRVAELTESEGAYTVFSWLPNSSGGLILDDSLLNLTRKGSLCLVSASVQEGQVLTVYLAGELPESLPEWEFYLDRDCENSTVGTMELVNTENLTFFDFADQYYTDSLDISRSDWACWLAAEMLYYEFDSNVLHFRNDLSYEYIAYRWLEYELTLEPGETVVNTVTMPAYPDVNLSNGNQWFCCTLDILSMRIYQPQNGPVITVNTPYPMTESSEEFTETENGYTLDMTGVYKVRLELTLEKEYIPPVKSPVVPNWDPLQAVVLCIPAAVLLVIFLWPSRKHKK